MQKEARAMKAKTNPDARRKQPFPGAGRSMLWQWLHGPERDRALPVVLTRNRIYILPTRTGLLFFCVLIAMLLSAINYKLALGYALVYLLLGLGLAALFHTFRNLFSLQLKPGRAEPVFAGETAQFGVLLENTRAEGRRAFELAFERPVLAAPATESGKPSVAFTPLRPVLADLPPSTLVTVAVPCPALRRGVLDPGRITLATRYPLGLFRAWSYPYPPLACLVYPRPFPAPLPPPVIVPAIGAARGESGDEDFSGLRLRQNSDSLRHVAWKAAARNPESDILLVKQFSGGGAEELHFHWEAAADAAMGARKKAAKKAGQNLAETANIAADDTELRLSILTGWILAAEASGQDYGLSIPGFTRPVGHGKAHREICLKALAGFGLEGGLPDEAESGGKAQVEP
ncbi:MAG: DUF58 domain-containing protein [Betaproteobacteria bacterium]|nr:DUF58 domain-containing protein [Betaproteobacteria bacterium]